MASSYQVIHILKRWPSNLSPMCFLIRSQHECTPCTGQSQTPTLDPRERPPTDGRLDAFRQTREENPFSANKRDELPAHGRTQTNLRNGPLRGDGHFIFAGFGFYNSGDVCYTLRKGGTVSERNSREKGLCTYMWNRGTLLITCIFLPSIFMSSPIRHNTSYG